MIWLHIGYSRWNCHTSKFDSCCAYRSGEIRVLRTSPSSICFPWATNTVFTLLFRDNENFHACKSDSDPVDHCGDIMGFALGQLLVDNDDDNDDDDNDDDNDDDKNVN